MSYWTHYPTILLPLVITLYNLNQHIIIKTSCILCIAILINESSNSQHTKKSSNTQYIQTHVINPTQHQSITAPTITQLTILTTSNQLLSKHIHFIHTSNLFVFKKIIQFYTHPSNLEAFIFIQIMLSFNLFNLHVNLSSYISLSCYNLSSYNHGLDQSLLLTCKNFIHTYPYIKTINIQKLIRSQSHVIQIYHNL